MKKRDIVRTVTGHSAVDGAGVHLTRVLGIRTVEDYDPFLMLDSFDSTHPEDYIKGFPMHPHRGIETITYLIEGEIKHEDSLGNKGVIRSGQAQWMTAGSGILHQEMPVASPRMLGVQLWLNLPRAEKMTHPVYFEITGEKIPQVQTDAGTVRVISGRYGDAEGVMPRHIAATFYDISLYAGCEIEFPTDPQENVFLFLIEGDAEFAGQRIPAKTAVLFGPGDTVSAKAPDGASTRILFLSAKPLREPVAWGGPVVMNTEEELRMTFAELEKGTFIKHNAAK